MNKRIWDRFGRDELAKNSLWMFLGYGLKIIVQAGYFILIARALGPEQYGAFVGVAALIALLAPFGGLGAGHLLIKNVSRRRELFAEYWGNALLMSAVSGISLLGVVMLVSRFLMPASIPWMLVLLVSVADLLFVKGAEIAAQCFQAMDELQHTSMLTLLPSILRLAGAGIVFIALRPAAAVNWGWFYCGAAIISCAVAIVLVSVELGRPKLALWRIPRELEEGFYFGSSLSAQTVYNDIDKMMLARFSTLDATGIYAAAYRIIDVSFAPVRSVLYAAYSNFFRCGKDGMAASYAYAKKLLPKMMAYSLLIFVVLFATAQIIPYILGKDYVRSVEALRWLALLPFFKAIHYFLGDSLSGAGYARIRTVAQVAVAVFNVLINLWLIPAYSWRGAAWSSLASDGALVLAMYTAVLYAMSKEARLGVRLSAQRLEQS
jgi:O-antigen/teichoic acid export membrane protein